MSRSKLGLSGPPQRAQAVAEDTGKLTASRNENERTKLCNWLPAHRVRYLRKLSAETGIQQRDLLIEAIGLLEAKYGKV